MNTLVSNTNNIPPYEIGNPMINNLIDTLNSENNKESFVISNWKDKLSEISLQDTIEIIKLLNSNKHIYTTKTLIPYLSEDQNIRSINILLTSLNEAYTGALTNDKGISNLRDNEREAIVKKLKLLFRNNLLRNRMLLGIFLYLSSKGEGIDKYESNFLKNIKDWLFTGNDTKELRDTVTESNDLPNEKQEIAQLLQ